MSRVVLSSILLFVSACGEGSPELSISPEQASDSAIINGTEAYAEADRAVVALIDTVDGQTSACSGTMIARGVVLTAGHCIRSTHPAVYFDLRPGTTPTIVEAYDAAVTSIYEATQVVADLALVRFDPRDPGVPADIRAIPVLPERLALDASSLGTPARMLGFGRKKQSESLSLALLTRRSFENTIGAFCNDAFVCPFLEGLVFHGNVAFDNSDGGPCQGDSGGPVLVEREGATYVAAVNANVGSDDTGGCYGVFQATLVTLYSDFIEAFIAGDPPAEVEWPHCLQASCAAGMPCTSNADCGPVGLCLTADEGMVSTAGYCSSVCWEGRACDLGGVCVGEGLGSCLASCAGGATCSEGNGCVDATATTPATCNPQNALNGGSGDACSRNQDCASGESCWPLFPGAPLGFCHTACTADEQCDGTCNELGLCGALAPPEPDPVPDPNDQVDDDGGCAAVATPPWLLLALAPGLLRLVRRWRGLDGRAGS